MPAALARRRALSRLFVGARLVQLVPLMNGFERAGRGKRRTLVYLAALGTLAALAACKSSGGGGETPPPAELPALGLPSKAFVQVQEEAPGTMRDIDTFLAGSAELGTLKLRALEAGMSELVVDDGGVQRVVGAKAPWLQVHALAAKDFRAVCATRVFSRGRAAGPRGPVIVFDTQKGAELLCFVNRSGLAEWQPITVATGDRPGGPRALWTFLLTVVNPDAPDDPKAVREDAMRGVEINWFEDEHWDQGWMTAASRTDKSGLYSTILRLSDSGAPVTSPPKRQASYLEGAQLMDRMVSECEPEQCGAVWTGRSLLSCTATCAAGESCKNTRCAAGACTRLSIEAACKVAGEADRCGAMPDGCGGTVQCAACSVGTCGGGGNVGRCGVYHVNEARLRTAYNDADSRLCGIFDDGAGGRLDLSASNRARFSGRECPKENQTCTLNLCVENRP